MTTSSAAWPALLDDPTGRSLGLPSGSLLSGTHEGPWYEPLLWISDDAVDAATWARHLRTPGLRPVLLQDERGRGRWWQDGLVPEAARAPEGQDAASAFAALWGWAVEQTEEDDEPDEDEDGDRDGGGTITPFGSEWPGLAAGRESDDDPDAVAVQVAGALTENGWLPGPRLGLVPVERGADALAAIGWAGAATCDLPAMSPVLRSWEDRFGARVIALHADRLHLSVAAPPRTPAEALPVAAEHFAFCPDTIWQGYDTIRAYVEERLLGSPHWTFWWD